jgi:hypothetical protein
VTDSEAQTEVALVELTDDSETGLLHIGNIVDPIFLRLLLADLLVRSLCRTRLRPERSDGPVILTAYTYAGSELLMLGKSAFSERATRANDLRRNGLGESVRRRRLRSVPHRHSTEAAPRRL